SRIAVGDARNAEIEDLGLAGLVDQYVCRFEIAVNEAALMRMVHRVADLHHDLQTLTGVQMVRFGILPRRDPTNKLHCEVRLRSEARIHGASFIDLGDAGMLQSAKRLGFLFKAAQQFRSRHTGLDNLECDGAAGLALFGFIDGAHSAFANQPENPVSTNDRRTRGNRWILAGRGPNRSFKISSTFSRGFEPQFEHTARAASARGFGFLQRTATFLAVI